MIAAIILIWLLLRRRLAGYTTQRPPYRSPSQAGRFGQSSPANYPPPFAQSSGIPIPAGNSTPPLPPPPQQGGTGGYPTYGQYGHQTGNQAQLLNSMPTEAYDAQRAYSMQQGNAQNASYGQSPNLPTCPNCGRPLVPNLPACGVCGMPLSAMRR
jgi:hypothetical protein